MCPGPSNYSNNNKKILKSLDIAGTIPLNQFSYIEQHAGLDCEIKNIDDEFTTIAEYVIAFYSPCDCCSYVIPQSK